MKKMNLVLAALAAVSMASCSSDEPVPVANGDGNVTFTVQLPQELESRAFSDGLTSTDLICVAYDATSHKIADETTATFTNLKTTVNLALVNGKTYNVVFWASKPGKTTITAPTATSSEPYYYDKDNFSLAVDYTKMEPNNDDYDAFYVCDTIAVAPTLTQKDVVLYRPFAQLNVGTNDLDLSSVKLEFGNNLENLRTSVATKAYNSLNLISGEAVGNTIDVSYTNIAPRPVNPTATTAGELETFPVSGYDYLSMCYLLQGKSNQLVETTTIKVWNNAAATPTQVGQDISVPQTPFRRNYRTNIYGNLLTNNVKFNVTIDPIYNLCPYNIPLPDWNGQIVTAADFAKLIDVANKTVAIYNAPQLSFLAQIVNNESSVLVDGVTFNNGASLKGYTVNLMNDINLRGGIWVPIGYKAYMFGGSGEHQLAWEGYFNGNNHSIYNMNVENADESGLFGVIAGGGSVKNLNLRRPTILKCKSRDDNSVGFVAGAIYRGGTIDNCHVFCGEINNPAQRSNGSQSGGIVGWAENFTITNCSVFKSIINSQGQVGGIVGHTDNGYTGGPNVIQNNVVDECNLKSQLFDAGGIAAQINNATVTGNTVKNTNIIAFPRFMGQSGVGPIGGLWNSTNTTDQNTIINVTINGTLWTNN